MTASSRLQEEEQDTFSFHFLLNFFADDCISASYVYSLSKIIIGPLSIFCLFILIFLLIVPKICENHKNKHMGFEEYVEFYMQEIPLQPAKDLLRPPNLAIHVYTFHLLVLHQMLQIAIDRLIRKARTLGDLIRGHIVALL